MNQKDYQKALKILINQYTDFITVNIDETMHKYGGFREPDMMEVKAYLIEYGRDISDLTIKFMSESFDKVMGKIP